jgi:cbb3-type cytochrome oxidase subunit 3
MLSFMAKGFFADSPVLILPITALVLFMVLFTAVCWRTFRRSARAELDRAARLPLEEDRRG